MAGWGRVVAGVVLGVAGTVYATNEEARKNLPKAARDLPKNVRRRFENAVAAGREASTTRREEILRDLEQRDQPSPGPRAVGEAPVRPIEGAVAGIPAAEEPPLADGSRGSEEASRR